MLTIRNVVETMKFKIKLSSVDKAFEPGGQPITVHLIFKDKSVPTYCEYHSRDLTWLTCNALWYLVSSAVTVETKPKELFRADDLKYKINHFEFFKSKANTLKELVGDEVYEYLVANVDVSKRY